MELLLGKSHNSQNIRKAILLVAITLVLLGTVPLYCNYPSLMQHPSQDSSELTPPYHAEDVEVKVPEFEKCDIFTGEWVPNPEAPYYTNSSCWAIHEHQNCMKYGRPDTGFMRWRWKPDGCDLPIFNPFQFLDIVRGKSLAFVGDSVGRNQMQSLICMLSRKKNFNQGRRRNGGGRSEFLNSKLLAC
ncbi:hypothetical protein Leryth_020760 [Lithospermum erythrorhizon]|uniref:Trichome birefringence-like N-terminal domain-containing protein n=1 Tax=Lithospermum erythrorhizon TaxID=34254 RepID=A0AAV3RWY0_LITER|nr:hypothetical protein Leryth_020760 [Lithospermum erythrorhizon]